jgi:hypothetical protein
LPGGLQFSASRDGRRARGSGDVAARYRWAVPISEANRPRPTILLSCAQCPAV